MNRSHFIPGSINRPHRMGLILGWSGAVLLTMASLTPAIAQVAQPFDQSLSTLNSAPSPALDYSLIYVNATTGQDQGQGSLQSPFRSLTRALQVAQPNTIIVLAPGTYSEATGEIFPLQLKPGVTVQGDARSYGQTTIIQGGGSFISPSFAHQNATVLAANYAGLTGVTVTNPHPQGYGLWVESSRAVIIANTFQGNRQDGMAIAGQDRSIVRQNIFRHNQSSGVSIFGDAQTELRNNVFENTGFGVNIAEQSAPILVGNRILGNRDGIVIQAQARPILRTNVIEANQRHGLTILAAAQPDLGTPDQAGGNIFRHNQQLDINASQAQQPVLAYGNQLSLALVTGQVQTTGAAIALAANPAPATPAPQATTPTLHLGAFIQTTPTVSTPAPSSPSSFTASAPHPATPTTTPPAVLESMAATPTDSSTTTAIASPASNPAPASATNEPSPEVVALVPNPSTTTPTSPSNPTPATVEPAAIAPVAITIIPVEPPSETPNPAVQPELAPSLASPEESTAIATPPTTTALAAVTVPPARTVPRLETPPSVTTTTAPPRPSLPQPTVVPPPPASVAAPTYTPMERLTSRRDRAASPVATSTPTSPTAIPIPVEAPPVATPDRPSPSLLARSQPSPTAMPSGRELEFSAPTTSTPDSTPGPTLTRLTRRSSSAPAPTSTPSSTSGTAVAITIPVPPPERVSPAANPDIARLEVGSRDRLPVPGIDIPLAQGNIPSVNVALSTAPNPNEPPPPPSRANLLGLPYRVIVAAVTEAEQNQVRAIVPGAFRVQYNGDMVLQAGAYRDRAEADALLQRLLDTGLHVFVLDTQS